MKSPPLHLVALVVLPLICGIGASLVIADNLEAEGRSRWLQRAKVDVTRVTDIANAWLLQTETAVRAVASRIPDTGAADTTTLQAALDDIDQWGLEVTPEALAAIRRLRRDDRAAFERRAGGPISTVGNPAEPAPSAFESFPVIATTAPEGPLAPRADLATHPAMRMVATAALRRPGQVFTGPFFDGPGGAKLALVGLTLGSVTDGALIGTLNMSEFFDGLISLYVPKGIVLRLFASDHEALVSAAYKPVLGPVRAAPDTAETITIRITHGQARWQLNWDIMPDYLGGPPVHSAETVRYGGSALSLALTLMIAVLSLRNLRISAEVEARTAELRESEERLQLQVVELRDNEQRLEAQSAELVGLAEDVELVRLELQKQNDQKDKFFSIIAHDLRGPFGALLGATSMLSDYVEHFDKVKIAEYATNMNRTAQTVFKLLENLLEWSRLQMGQLEFEPAELNLKAIVDTNRELFEPTAEEKGIRLVTDCAEALSVFADEHMVDTIVRNLINNALKFTPAGGEVRIGAHIADDWAVVEISDTGVGIPADKIGRLFRLDEKTSTVGTGGETGTGLGLNLCEDLVKTQGGRISVESTEGEGSVFRFTLPLTGEPSAG